jgi:hypothetical protein
VCGFKRVDSRIARGRVGVSIMQMGQSSNSMGVEWTGIRTCVYPQPLPQVMVSILEIMVNPHTHFLSCFALDAMIFFLRRLKINHMRYSTVAMNVHLLLGLLALLKTVWLPVYASPYRYEI